jgi:hypothetical protein
MISPFDDELMGWIKEAAGAAGTDFIDSRNL